MRHFHTTKQNHAYKYYKSIYIKAKVNYRSEFEELYSLKHSTLLKLKRQEYFPCELTTRTNP